MEKNRDFDFCVCVYKDVEQKTGKGEGDEKLNADILNMEDCHWDIHIEKFTRELSM